MLTKTKTIRSILIAMALVATVTWGSGCATSAEDMTPTQVKTQQPEPVTPVAPDTKPEPLPDRPAEALPIEPLRTA